jgi:dihydroflavonol-4-reductase
VSRDPRDDWKMYDIHIGGTRNICEAALEHRPEKLVVVSSSGTIAVSAEPEILDETAGYPLETIGNWAYYLSKVYTEKMVLDYVRRHELPVVIANPALLLGPGDDLGSSTGDVALFLKGQVMALPLGGMCFVDARDAAAGLIAAMRAGRIGERYLLGGANWSFKRIIETVAEISGKRPPILQPPLGFSLWSARILRKILPLVGREMDMDDVTIKMSAHFWYFSSKKAESELGFTARDPVETLLDTVEDITKRPS